MASLLFQELVQLVLDLALDLHQRAVLVDALLEAVDQVNLEFAEGEQLLRLVGLRLGRFGHDLVDELLAVERDDVVELIDELELHLRELVLLDAHDELHEVLAREEVLGHQKHLIAFDVEQVEVLLGLAAL